jgi:hypothetical protein
VRRARPRDRCVHFDAGEPPSSDRFATAPRRATGCLRASCWKRPGVGELVKQRYRIVVHGDFHRGPSRAPIIIGTPVGRVIHSAPAPRPGAWRGRISYNGICSSLWRSVRRAKTPSGIRSS